VEIVPALTVNYGVRFDHYTAFSSGSQVSPRINFVWQAFENTTIHAGYSKFFSPPPFELIANASVVKFCHYHGRFPGYVGRARQGRKVETITTSVCSRS